MAKAKTAPPNAQLQLREADRETYGAPEWLDYQAGLDRLGDLDYDALKVIEDQILAAYSVSLMRFVAVEYPSYSFESVRVRAWLGMLAAGIDIKLAEFKPNCFNLLNRPRPQAADADPPSGTSES